MSNPSNPFNHRWEWVPLNPAPNPFSDPKADSAPVPVYARTYFTLCQYQNSLLLYAGFGDKTGRFSDLIVFDGTSKGWRLVNCKGELPKPVYLHSAAVLSNYMYIFGGNTGKDSNMFHRLNLDTYTWQNLGTLTGSPSARYGHASCALTELNQIYVVGGSYGNSQYSNESFSYNVQTSQWRRLADFPVASAYHTLVPYRGRILSIGGYNGSVFVQHVYEYVPEDNRWTIFSTSGDVPPASCGNAVSLHGDTIYVFGGKRRD
jgi:N-acetylneuraminic acid mutarotase